MFILLDPQPHHEEDVPNWQRGPIKGHGLGISNGEMFVPFPEKDMHGVRIVQLNDWWYWARPAFYNPKMPSLSVRVDLEDLHAFSGRQLDLIANAVNYVDNHPSGVPGHQLHLIVAMIYELLISALFQLNTEQRATVAKQFKEWEITHI